MSDIAAAGLFGTAIKASIVAATLKRPHLRYAIAIMLSPCKRAKHRARPTSIDDVGAFSPADLRSSRNINLEQAT